MKRNIVIATVAAAALVGSGTATALAVSGDDAAPATRASDVRVTDDDAQGSGARQDDDAQDDAGQDADGQDDGGQDDGGQDSDAAQAASARVKAADAVSAALRHTPGTAVSADLDDDDDGSVAWEVDVLAENDAWHSVRIDPATGKVLSSHTEHEDDTAQVRAALKGASTSAAEAAKAVTGKGTVTSVDLDEDGADKGWSVQTRASGKAEQEWTVDLKTGKVTADRSDDDAGHGADHDGDDD
jgi:uncharacterized membrane protein YkoI